MKRKRFTEAPQRMAYAAQLRQQGLQKEDQRLLDQAEQYERKALAAYQARIQQFEKTDLNSKVTGRASNRGKVSKASQGKQSTTKSQALRRSSQVKRKSARSRSPRSAKSVWGWLR